MPTTTTTTTKTEQALAAFRVASPRSGGFAYDAKAKSASVPAISDAAIVTRGARVTRNGAEVPMLLVRDGSATRGLELSAVGAAIASGVITSEEIAALTA